MKTSLSTEVSFLGLEVLEFDILECLQKNSLPFTEPISQVLEPMTHTSGPTTTYRLCPQQGPDLCPHLASVNWNGTVPRPPVSSLGLHFTASSVLETDSSPQGCTCRSPCFQATGSKELEPLNYCRAPLVSLEGTWLQ